MSWISEVAAAPVPPVSGESGSAGGDMAAEGLLVSADGRIVSADAALAHLFGAAGPQDLCGLAAIELFDHANRPAIALRIDRAGRSGNTQALFDEHCRRLDGSVFPANVVIEPTFSDGVAGIRMTIRSLTGGPPSPGEAGRREAQLESILATVPDGVIVIDETGILLSFSPAAERLFGYPATEVLGRNVSLLMPSPYHEQHEGYIKRYLATGERRIIGVGRVVRGQRRDGTTFPVELAIGEVRLEDGGRLFTGFVRDLTERQEREQRLHELQSELIHVSRLSELGQMVSALAHEVNQPLTAVENYLRAGERLLAVGDAGKARSALGRAAEQAARATGIIRRLREFVRKGGTDRRIESLPKVIEEAVALAFVGSRGRNIAVTTRFDPQASTAYIDRIQIQQVLFNLMRNAIEAMEDGERQSLAIATEPAENGMILVSVADTGPGLDPRVRDRLFQPFVTTKSSGIGVGLSICRSMIEAHGGRMSALDNPQGGTVFQFTLPTSAPERDGAAGANDADGRPDR